MYACWTHMLSRCENPEDREFHNYGGRGIRVCSRWHDLDTFIADIERDPGPRPPGLTPGGMPVYSLNRKDNDGDYEPGNVDWATGTAQLYNSRKHFNRRVVEPETRFGSLVVIREVEPVISRNRSKADGGAKHRAVLCLCDCGAEATVKLGNLPRTYSCGCLKRETMRVLAAERFGSGGAFFNSGNDARRLTLRG
jgi:hypothetical protein